jgi:hypothetical protein
MRVCDCDTGGTGGVGGVGTVGVGVVGLVGVVGGVGTVGLGGVGGVGTVGVGGVGELGTVASGSIGVGLSTIHNSLTISFSKLIKIDKNICISWVKFSFYINENILSEFVLTNHIWVSIGRFDCRNVPLV